MNFDNKTYVANPINNKEREAILCEYTICLIIQTIFQLFMIINMHIIWEAANKD